MTVVDELYERYTEILQTIPEDEISLRNIASETFRKVLLLSAASLFEKQFVAAIRELVRVWGSDNEALNEFVRRKAIERQYHTYFDWDSQNASKFFVLFGDGFKSYMRQRLIIDQSLENSIKAFIEIGSDRNRTVHQDFGSFVLEKTDAEIYVLYQAASGFIARLAECFSDFETLESEPD